jgi:hypothetical protein
VICSVPITVFEVPSNTYSTKSSPALVGVAVKSANASAIVVPKAILVITIGPSSLPIAPPFKLTVNVKVGVGVGVGISVGVGVGVTPGGLLE